MTTSSLDDLILRTSIRRPEELVEECQTMLDCPVRYAFGDFQVHIYHSMGLAYERTSTYFPAITWRRNERFNGYEVIEDLWKRLKHTLPGLQRSQLVMRDWRLSFLPDTQRSAVRYAAFKYLLSAHQLRQLYLALTILTQFRLGDKLLELAV